MLWISSINDLLWTYILIIMLLGCAVWFTIRTRFVAVTQRLMTSEYILKTQ